MTSEEWDTHCAQAYEAFRDIDCDPDSAEALAEMDVEAQFGPRPEGEAT